MTEAGDALDPGRSGMTIAPLHRKVMVVDDVCDARAAARRALEEDGFSVIEAAGGAAAIAALEESNPDLVILDLTMPEVSGLEILARLRRNSEIPVIVLTGSGGESERVLAFELGADDYVVKPFLSRELPARVRAVLRRSIPVKTTPALDFGALVILPVEREVVLDGTLVETTAREFDLLAHLASRPRRVFTRAQLLEEVWKSSKDWQDPATVTEHIRRLRRKIETNPERPRWLVTVRGVGYRFEP